jgi:hypothetical protein
MYVVVHDFSGPNQTPGYERYQYLHQALERLFLVRSCTCDSDPILIDTNALDQSVAWSGRHWSPVSPDIAAEWLDRLGITA